MEVARVPMRRYCLPTCPPKARMMEAWPVSDWFLALDEAHLSPELCDIIAALVLILYYFRVRLALIFPSVRLSTLHKASMRRPSIAASRRHFSRPTNLEAVKGERMSLPTSVHHY